MEQDFDSPDISEFIAACAKQLLSGVRKTNRAK
jgi:hypothetical protein